MTLSSWLALAAFVLLFLGERIFGTNDTARWVLDLLGLVALGGSVGLRVRDLKAAASASARDAHRKALVALLVGTGGLVFYALGLDTVVEALGLSEDAEPHWVGSWHTLFPILVLLGALPMVLVDRAILASPLEPHPRRIRTAVVNGTSLALALALLFPLNYLAKEYNQRWDLTYFRTAMPGTSTQALVDNLEEPVRAVLFFPPANDVAEEARVYFEALEGANLSVEVLDHAMEPALAEELRVRENGQVALVQGDNSETIKLDTDLDKARRKLEKLDANVQEALFALARGERVAYFTVGHGEMSWQGRSERDRKLTLLKKLLSAMNYRVKTLGMGEGLASAIPDDATAVFVMGPTANFLDEEIAALNRYREAGGSLFIALEPGIEPDVDLSPLVEPLGLSWSDVRLVTDDAKTYLPMKGGITDRQNLGTNRYSSHESVTTLSRNSRMAWMIFPGVGSLAELDDHRGKVTVTVRSLGKVWADENGNFEYDRGQETRKVRNIAAVASGPATAEDSEYRAVVVADATFTSDLVLGNKANAQFMVDATHWLAGEEEFAGTVNDEEDVKIVHNKEGQGIWFYGTTFLVPLLLGVFGFIRVRSRRKGVA